MAFSKNLPHPGANQGNLRENPLTTTYPTTPLRNGEKHGYTD